MATHFPVEEARKARLWRNVKLDPLVPFVKDGIATDGDLFDFIDFTGTARLSLGEFDSFRANVARAGACRRKALGGCSWIGVAALLESVGAAVGARISHYRVKYEVLAPQSLLVEESRVVLA